MHPKLFNAHTGSLDWHAASRSLSDNFGSFERFSAAAGPRVGGAVRMPPQIRPPLQQKGQDDPCFKILFWTIWVPDWHVDCSQEPFTTNTVNSYSLLRNVKGQGVSEFRQFPTRAIQMCTKEFSLKRISYHNKTTVRNLVTIPNRAVWDLRTIAQGQIVWTNGLGENPKLR